MTFIPATHYRDGKNEAWEFAQSCWDLETCPDSQVGALSIPAFCPVRQKASHQSNKGVKINTFI